MAGKTLPEIYAWGIKIEALYVYMASTKKGAFNIGLTLENQGDSVTYFKERIPKYRPIEGHDQNRPLIQAVEASLFNKKSRKIPSLDISCSAFLWKALKAIYKIPFGETKSYGEVAKNIGQPAAARAVGQAMGANPLPLIFP